MMSRHVLICVFVVSSGVAFAEPPQFAASTSTKPVRVFILAGQSNMEGRGFAEPLAWQTTQPEFRDRYTHFIKDGDFDAFNKKVAETKDPDDRRKSPTYLWSSRKDVWINYLGKHGDLTVGYGAPKDGFGPEFNFGHVVGNAIDEQVLIIKTSWGGRALAKGFLPPSSIASDDEYARMAKELNDKNKAWNEEEPARIEKYNARIVEENKKRPADKQKRPGKFKPREMITDADFKAQYGKDYRNMVREVHECLADSKDGFLATKGRATKWLDSFGFRVGMTSTTNSG